MRSLAEEAAALKARLDDVTAKLLKAIAGKRPRPQLEALDGSATGARARRVLLVDHDLEARDVLEVLVVRLGNVVEVAANGVDGLAAIHHFKPEVVFVELGVPGLDGYAVARGALESLGAKAPLLIAYTAPPGAGIEAAALAAGFARHIAKPIAMDALRQLLHPQSAVTP